MRIILVLAFIAIVNLKGFSQDVQKTEIKNQTQLETYSYAYISIQGKAFSKKLKVEVDFGDTPEQLKAGREYSEILTNKKSYAAVLNYMAERQFELVESHDRNYVISSSTLSTSTPNGFIILMRKKNWFDFWTIGSELRPRQRSWLVDRRLSF